MTDLDEIEAASPARGRGRVWVVGFLLLAVIAALAWFVVIGTTTRVQATAEGTCAGARVTTTEISVPRFAPSVAITTQEWGQLQINRRLFRETRYTFVAPNESPVELREEPPHSAGYHCPG